MSFQALGWAAGVQVKRASDKLVLLGLADRHHTDSGTAYPSLAWLCDFSSLDRKTVIAALARLEAAGLISDSGERTGRTGQIKAYILHFNSSEKGTVKTEPLPSKGADFPTKQSRKRNTETVRETPSDAKASSGHTRQANPFPKPEGVDAQVWRDFLENRRRKRLPNTATAHKRLMDDLKRLADSEWTIPRLLEHAAAKGWAGIYDPRAEQESKRAPPTQSSTSYLDFYRQQSRQAAGATR